ncbi:MAG: MltA domain-containing protein [Rubrivivax sp.]
MRVGTGALILGTLAGCGLLPPAQAPAPLERRDATGPVAGTAAAPAAPAAAAEAPAPPGASAPAPPPPPPPAPPVDPRRVRWQAADWGDLAGWSADRSADLWPALRNGCTRPAPGWNELCARVLLEPAPATHEAARQWLVTHLQPWRIESADGRAEGLATGYFEPTIEASRRPRGAFRVPLHAPPADLATRRPYWTRQQLDTLPAAQDSLRGREIAWIEDPLDALMLQVQGSGRLRFTEPGGRATVVRLAFAAHNDQPYRSLGRWLVDQGELTLEAASWPAVKDWARRNPRRVNELLWTNPRVVFFREEPLPDPALGPRGSQGVPLTPGRSVAVDPQALPYGSVLWLDTTEPMAPTPLRRLVVAQDSGGAITGAVRIDLFFGWQADAEQQAGRMKQALRLWVLWPRGVALPVTAP